MAHKVSEQENGVVVYQVTDEPGVKDNIYCERSYSPPDSSFFLWRRQLGGETAIPHKWFSEFVACDFGTWESRTLFKGLSYPEMSRSENMYFERLHEDGARRLSRIDLVTGETKDIPVDGGVRPWTGMTISPCENFLAYGVALSFSPQMFGVELVDLRTGEKRIIHEDPCISNPHPQIDPFSGRRILVQHNRGSRFGPDGSAERTLGPEGCSFFMVTMEDGEVSRLQVGPPYTPTMSGHSQWTLDEEAVLTAWKPWTDGDKTGTLLAVAADGPPRLVTEGNNFNHLHVTRCGRYFCCDDILTGDVFIGSVKTGRKVWVTHCGHDHTEINPVFGEPGHTHANLSPDRKWMVFNSCRTGRPEVHVASIPAELYEGLA